MRARVHGATLGATTPGAHAPQLAFTQALRPLLRRLWAQRCRSLQRSCGCLWNVPKYYYNECAGKGNNDSEVRVVKTASDNASAHERRLLAIGLDNNLRIALRRI